VSTTPGRPHRGRRDNGLDAPEFVALADVDPRIGEHLLDVLGVVGIAAYLAPSADLNPVVRATTLPARPTDRLWVDRDRLDEARGLYEAVQEDEAASATPSRPSTALRRLEVDVDAEWEKIVAGYDATAAPDRPRRRASDDAEEKKPSDPTSGPVTPVAPVAPVADPTADPLPTRRPGESESQPPAEPPAPENTGTDPEPPKSTPPTAGLIGPITSVNRLGPIGRDRLTGTDAPFDLGESEEGYEPPPPPPLPRLSLPLTLSVVAIVAGMVLLFRSGTMGLGEDARLLLALCGILGGAGALVWRLRDGWNDDDNDDGAVV
jgi:hypothetical protein